MTGAGRASDAPVEPTRGEPRLFTLGWMLFLLGALLTTVLAARPRGGVEVSTVRLAADGLFAVVAFGVGLLWPMVRLSQARAARPIGATLADFVVVAAPMQVVIWPMRWLTLLGWEVLAGVSVALTGWALVSAGLIALGMRTASGVARTMWMGATAVVACGSAALALLASGLGVDAGAPWLASPLTVAHALTAAPSGIEPSMTAEEWRLAIAPCGLGAVLLLGAAGWGAMTRRQRGMAIGGGGE